MGRLKTKASPVVIVVWTDAAFSAAEHWQEGTQPARPRKPYRCITAGWLTHLDDHHAQITQTLSDGQHAHVADIPRGMIESITVMAPVEPQGKD